MSDTREELAQSEYMEENGLVFCDECEEMFSNNEGAIVNGLRLCDECLKKEVKE